MTKKAQFIIPNVFIKEAKFGGLARLMVRGRRAYRAFKGVKPQSRAAASSATPVTVVPSTAGSGPVRNVTPAANTAPVEESAYFRQLPSQRTAANTAPQMRQAKGRPNTAPVEESAYFRQLPSQRTAANTAPQLDPSNPMRQAKGRVVEPLSQRTAANTAAESTTYSPGAINRFLSSTIGRVALPVATGAAGYGFGNSSGYDEGFGQGALSAQQMAAIQAMQAQQQARQMYDNQGFLDRLMGNNPF